MELFGQFKWYQVICMNGPEGFLPKNQNFMTQVARILWYRPIIIPKQLYSSFVCKLLLGRRWREEVCGQSITSPLPADTLLSSATPPRFSCSTCQFYAVKQGSRNYSVVLSGYLSRHNQPGSHFFSTLLISFKRVFVSTSALPGSALAAAPHWGW